MRTAKRLLEALTEALPPGGGQRHGIAVADGNLVVTLMLGEFCVPAYLEDEDLDRPAGEIAEEIVALVKAEHPQLVEGEENHAI